MFDFHKLKMKPKPGQGMCPGQNWSPRCLHGGGGLVTSIMSPGSVPSHKNNSEHVSVALSFLKTISTLRQDLKSVFLDNEEMKIYVILMPKRRLLLLR